MQQTLVSQGVDLMLYGMGTVFVFLVILVFATMLMSRVVSHYSPQAVTENESVSTANVDPVIVKAIQSALDQHRGRSN